MISPNPESVLCHCLRITVGQVQCAIEENRPNSVRDVMRMTGAGKGCMSCHARIKAMLAGRMLVSTFAVPSCSGCTNPVCGCAAACPSQRQTTIPSCTQETVTVSTAPVAPTEEFAVVANG